ncbi:NB-ARC domain-containing protein [Streptomyces sp. APSN-46.1]|uniref:NB-ARC domain-containing protein n=1 Tax=Streptomyces sp. APSN-46.1 TaxID=2929049 RepID=UPI001FB48DD5|nr:NB-ARC domain-containing protein [Streptomyces sp. APSN-46.1]MCJ1678326.1 NB-ARC domain-containing protein [Streptomyces sp. APSN-46.1]
MGRPEKPLAPDAGPATAFARELRRLRAAAGSPSYREMARSALFSSTVLSDAAAGYRLPTLQVALAFVETCGGDRSIWERRWREAARAAGGESQPSQAGPAAKAAAQRQETELHAAALRALLPAPAQLPREMRTLTGRTRQLQQARALTQPGCPDTAAPLVISGQLGVGKSAFALRLAHELAAGLPDGQLYADLGRAEEEGRDASDIAAGFLGALGIPADRIPQDAGQRLGLYRSVLARRRVLILLDDVRHEHQVRQLIDIGPESRIVITSRSRLLGLDGTRGLRLGVLDRDESVELLAGLIGGDRTGAAARAVLRLAEACGDLPLALNLAGRRIAARPEWLLDEAVTELTEPGGFLGRLRAGDESVYQRIETAYRGLGPWARLVLRQFAGSAARLSADTGVHEVVDSLARSLERPVAPVEELLDELVETGLLERSQLAGQYGMLALVREFALALADPTRPSTSGGTGEGTSGGAGSCAYAGGRRAMAGRGPRARSVTGPRP